MYIAAVTCNSLPYLSPSVTNLCRYLETVSELTWQTVIHRHT